MSSESSIEPSPDELLRRYMALRHLRSSPRAFDPVAMQGLWRDRACGRCKGTKWVSTRAKGGGEIDRCARCGRPWGVEVRIIPKGVIQSSPIVGAHEQRLVELATLGQMFSRVPLWHLRAWVVYLETRSSRDAADECQDRWPRAPFAWTRQRVLMLTRAARAAVEAAIARSTDSD